MKVINILSGLVSENYESKSKSSSGLDELKEDIGGTCLGGLVMSLGVLLGAGIGELVSTDDVILYEIPPGYKLLPLKLLACYLDEEPEYLRAIK